MPQQPTTSTDRLVNVIQVIQLGRKTGTLTVERNNNTQLERGTVYFVNGLVTQASADQLSGLAAFQWLNTWGNCRFTFTPSDSSATTRKLPSIQPAQAPAPEHERIQDTEPALHIQAQVKSFSGSAMPKGRHERQILSTQQEPVNIPIQVRPIEDALQRIQQMKLSRSHRHLFLLVDGHRNVVDLARLMGRRQIEVSALLQDLKRADVITY